MQIDNLFAAGASLAKVWNLLLDVERVAPRMPGAELTRQRRPDLSGPGPDLDRPVAG